MRFRYTKNLSSAKDFGIRKGIYAGVGMGLVFFVIFASYSLAFWYGGKLVREDDYTAGQMLVVSISYHKSHVMHINVVCLVDGIKKWMYRYHIGRIGIAESV